MQLFPDLFAPISGLCLPQSCSWIGVCSALGSYDPTANRCITPILPAPMPGLCSNGVKKKHGDTDAVGTLQLSEEGEKKKKLDPCETSSLVEDRFRSREPGC